MSREYDKFLPKYLVGPFIANLANALAAAPTETPTPNKAGEKFLATIKKNAHGFTELTAAIFWQDDIDKVLAKNLDKVNKADYYLHSPLNYALANEDFVTALKLIENQAVISIVDKLLLEIATASIIERNPKIIEIMVNQAEDADKYWIHDYLNFIQEYLEGRPSEVNYKYRNVLDPPVRRFGQVLDTTTYTSKGPSYFGFIGPALQALTQHLQDYQKELQERRDQQLLQYFTNIAKAYENCFNTCKFVGNYPKAKDIGQIFAKQVAPCLGSSNEILVVPGGFAGNAMAIAITRNKLILTNIGVAGNKDFGTAIYNIKNPDQLNAEFFELFINGFGNATSASVIFAAIGAIVDPEPITTIVQANKKVDNSIVANPRALIQAIIFVMDERKFATDKARQVYLQYLNSLYKYFTENLAQSMRNPDLLMSDRLDCCSLAIEYINQHFNTKNEDIMERCIELKNTIEYVGFGHMYTQLVRPEAQKAILDRVIVSQEITATEVIRAEKILLAQGLI